MPVSMSGPGFFNHLEPCAPTATYAAPNESNVGAPSEYIGTEPSDLLDSAQDLFITAKDGKMRKATDELSEISRYRS